MGELKLYGMKAAFDEIMAIAVKRQHEPQRIVGDLLNAEISEKQARSIKYQLTIAVTPHSHYRSVCGGSGKLGAIYEPRRMLPSVIDGPGGCFDLAGTYSARFTEMIFSIECVCPTLWKVPVTRHFSPTAHAFSGSPSALRSIVQM
jgi:hypothetical protein